MCLLAEDGMLVVPDELFHKELIGYYLQVL